MTAPTCSTWLEWRDGHAALNAAGRYPIKTSALRDFGGVGDAWSPEELLLASLQTCITSTFMALSRHSGLAVLGCSSTAHGSVVGAAGAWALGAINICVQVVINREEQRVRVLELVEEAHRTSVVARSMRGNIAVDVTVVVEDQRMLSCD